MNKKQQKEIGKLYNNLVRFSEQEQWRYYKEETYDELHEFIAKQEEITTDEAKALLNNINNKSFRFMINELINIKTLLRLDLKSFCNLLDEYSKRKAWNDSAFMRRCLKAWNNSTINIWEVVRVVRNGFIELKSCDGENQIRRVYNKDLSNIHDEGTHFAATIAEIDGAYEVLHLPVMVYEEGLDMVISERKHLIALSNDPSSMTSIKSLQREGVDIDISLLMKRLCRPMLFNSIILAIVNHDQFIIDFILSDKNLSLGYQIRSLLRAD